MTKKQVKIQAKDLEEKLIALLRSEKYMNYTGDDDDFADNICHMNRAISVVLDNIRELVES